MNESLAEKIGLLLNQKQLTISVAESCTGGLVGDMITNIAGSSQYFLGGIIAYDNRIKIDILGVDEEIIDTYGAVSEQTVKKMAMQVKTIYKSSIGLATTGIAGPGGGSSDKPVGLVYIGLASNGLILAKKFLWSGNRVENKKQSALVALSLLQESLASKLF